MRGLQDLWADTRGAAAVELALALPVLAGMAALSFNVWDAAGARERAAVATRAAITYYFNGGINDAEAIAIGTEAWSDPPSDARLVVNRVYRCGEAPNAMPLCPSGAPADTYAALEAKGSSEGLAFSSTFKVTRNVRIR